MMKVKIIARSLASETVKLDIERNLDVDYRELIQLEMVPRRFALRGVDPTVLVATISTTGSVLVALITALIQIMKEKDVSHIVIHSRYGTKIEIPRSYSLDELDKLLEKVRQMDVDYIQVGQ